MKNSQHTKIEKFRKVYLYLESSGEFAGFGIEEVATGALVNFLKAPVSKSSRNLFYKGLNEGSNPSELKWDTSGKYFCDTVKHRIPQGAWLITYWHTGGYEAFSAWRTLAEAKQAANKLLFTKIALRITSIYKWRMGGR